MHSNIGYWGQSEGDKGVADRRPQLPLFLQLLQHVECKSSLRNDCILAKGCRRDPKAVYKVSPSEKGARNSFEQHQSLELQLELISILQPINYCGWFVSLRR